MMLMSWRDSSVGARSCTGSWARSGTSDGVTKRGAPQLRQAGLRVRRPDPGPGPRVRTARITRPGQAHVARTHTPPGASPQVSPRSTLRPRLKFGLTQVNRALGRLEQNPRHPGLNSYLYQNFPGVCPDVQVWHS